MEHIVKLHKNATESKIWNQQVYIQDAKEKDVSAGSVDSVDSMDIISE